MHGRRTAAPGIAASTPDSILARYDALVAAGALEHDAAQVAVIEKLDRLRRRLAERETPAGAPNGLAARARAWLTGKSAPSGSEAPKGLYIHGLVGRGKTTLMDLFFDALDIERKRRAHFHAFMADVHARLHRARRAGERDPLARVASALAREARVFCFDEFSVTDIADAAILSRLFASLLAQGVVVVATSNVEPCRLYEGGRNRDLFLPFVALIEERLDVMRLDARTDFRLETHALGDVYLTPAGELSRHTIDSIFESLTGTARGAPMWLEVTNRRLEVPEAAGRVARFQFSDICSRPLGASDYHALAERFDTIIVEGAPKMNFGRRNEAKRFITLVDVLYEKKVRLVLSAEAEAHELYDASTGHEAQEFQRAVSRLMEMRSKEYFEKRLGADVCRAAEKALLE
jgi:cell division protein ZapE